MCAQNWEVNNVSSLLIMPIKELRVPPLLLVTKKCDSNIYHALKKYSTKCSANPEANNQILNANIRT